MIGYYYNIGNDNTPFVGKWQWRIGNCAGGERTREEAIKSLELMGATETSDVTREGRDAEFGRPEAA